MSPSLAENASSGLIFAGNADKHTTFASTQRGDSTRRRPVLAEEVLEAHVVGPMPVAEQAAVVGVALADDDVRGRELRAKRLA